MPEPEFLGWYHITCICIAITLCIIAVLFRHKLSDRVINNILLIFSIICVILEIIKLVISAYNNGLWDFDWDLFPFQFCSTPIYVSLIAGIIRKGKLHQALIDFLATFSLFAGIAVLLYIGDVFSSTIIINIYTMFLHGGMFVIGFMLLVSGKIELTYKTILRASLVFFSLLTIAQAMNIMWHFWGVDETFNMFHISPFYPSIYNIFGDGLPYIVLLLGYIVVMISSAFLIIWISILARNSYNKYQLRKKKNPNNY